MAVQTAQAHAAAAITGRMDFCPPGEKVIFYPTDRAKSQWPYRPHDVRIADARAIKNELAFDRNGFVLVERAPVVANYYDRAEIERVYLPHIAGLVAELTGADKVITFGTMTRTDAKNAAQGNQPAFGAHVDYGDYTVRRFAEEVLGKDEAARWLAGRYMLINVWRPIKVVQRSPLAVCDASTVAPSDLCDSEVRGGLGDPNRPTLYGFAVSFNPNQHWYYVPEMRPEEILVFKLYDSKRDAVQWTAHSAFDHKGIDPKAPPRESIEVRTIAFFKA